MKRTEKQKRIASIAARVVAQGMKDEAERKAQHTAGPWRLCTIGSPIGQPDAQKIKIEKGCFSPPWVIATIEAKDGRLISPSTELANARMIAAAPELLDALKAMLSEDDKVVSAKSPHSVHTIKKAMEIIAKAEGGDVA